MEYESFILPDDCLLVFDILNQTTHAQPDV